MQITINIPDTLPQERIKQRVKEFELSLIAEAKFFASISKQHDYRPKTEHLENSQKPKITEQTIENFILRDDGTVLDTKTDLMWCRYAIGQRWENGIVIGEARDIPGYEIEEVINSINKNHEIAGFNDWRIPKWVERKNLYSNIYNGFLEPHNDNYANEVSDIFKIIFPSIQTGKNIKFFWDYYGQDDAFAKLMSTGIPTATGSSIRYYVRLVRSS